MQIGCNMRECR